MSKFQRFNHILTASFTQDKNCMAAECGLDCGPTVESHIARTMVRILQHYPKQLLN